MYEDFKTKLVLFDETNTKKRKTNVIEDYIELQGVNLKFSCVNIYELTSDENINNDYNEMKKVFFSNEKNIFGHTYGSSLLTPFSQITNPIEAIKIIQIQEKQC